MANISIVFRRSHRISTYSALAAVFLLNHAQGEVTTVAVGEILMGGEYLFDFDGDGNDDFRIIQTTMGPGTSFAGINDIDNNGSWIATSSGTFVSALNANYLIDGSLSPLIWVDNGPINGNGILGSSNNGPFPVAGSKYIGVRFASDEDTYYGWIRLDLAPGSIALNIYEYAYETEPNMPILAGSEVSLPVTLSEFKARQEGKSIVLNWVTESEVENLGFILERRPAAKGHPELPATPEPPGEGGVEGWTGIASFKTNPDLKGQGNTIERTAYSFIDESMETGQSYDYRLSDVSYSTVNKGSSRVITNIQVESVQPSPFTPSPTPSTPPPASTTVSMWRDPSSCRHTTSGAGRWPACRCLSAGIELRIPAKAAEDHAAEIVQDCDSMTGLPRPAIPACCGIQQGWQ